MESFVGGSEQQRGNNLRRENIEERDQHEIVTAERRENTNQGSAIFWGSNLGFFNPEFKMKLVNLVV